VTNAFDIGGGGASSAMNWRYSKIDWQVFAAVE
jgi:hypothetical protein